MPTPVQSMFGTGGAKPSPATSFFNGATAAASSGDMGNMLTTGATAAIGLIPGGSFIAPLVVPLISKLITSNAAGDMMGSLIDQMKAKISAAAAAAAPSPAQAPAIAKAVALDVKQTAIDAGQPADNASTLGALAYSLTAVPPKQAPAALLAIASALPDSPLKMGFTKEDIKVIINGAVKGAKDGATDAYLDGTESGNQTKKDAIDAQGTKFLPYALGALLLFIFFRK